jgi:hypothetical protein
MALERITLTLEYDASYGGDEDDAIDRICDSIKDIFADSLASIEQETSGGRSYDTLYVANDYAARAGDEDDDEEDD